MRAIDKINQTRQPKKKVLDKDIAGMRAGQRMLVSTPAMIQRYISRIPPGQHRSIQRLRNELARRNQCDTTCPMTTSIFLRMVAEAAIEEMEQGASPDEVAPFWRVIGPQDKLAGKLPIDPQWISQQRAAEQAAA